VHHIEAAKYYKLAADQKFVFGQFNYGICLVNARDILADNKEAAKWFKRAAENDLPRAQVAAGMCAFLGIGCCVDFVEAEEFFKMAAGQGDAMCEFNYAIALSQQLNSVADLTTMSRYLKCAADQGLAFGQVNHAVFLFSKSDGSNEVGVVKYLKSAADQKEIHGELNYGNCLLDGRGVPKDESRVVCLSAWLSSTIRWAKLISVSVCTKVLGLIVIACPQWNISNLQLIAVIALGDSIMVSVVTMTLMFRSI
jgi:TPR repeat protein